MKQLERVLSSAVGSAREANLLAFNLMELERASRDVAAHIEQLRTSAAPPDRNALVHLLSHITHWRSHAAKVRRPLDDAIDRVS